MLTFVLAAILILLATLAFLVWPLLFTRNTFSYARHAQNIHYAKERLTELELQLKNASISATDYEALKLEIETTLAHDIDIANVEHPDTTAVPRRSNKLAIIALCLFVPLSASIFYVYVGTPNALNANSATPSSQSEIPSAQEVKRLISNLEQRLIETPDDLQGWQVLSRTYLALGQYGKASNSLRRVLELGGETAENYASLADALALAADGNMSGEPTQLADKALTLNPDNRQALWLRGLSAVQAGDKAAAKKYWGSLLKILSDQPQEQAQLKSIMAEALGTDTALTDSSPVTPAEEVSNKKISVTIRVAPGIADQLKPQDPVFVFARAVNGPPPPLAAKKLYVADLPATVTLSDEDAMMPQLKLSLFTDLEIVARVSKSGKPVARPGDYESKAAAAKSDQAEGVELLISELIK